ncbi:hypothetical protein ACFXO5_23795, partial [Bacillus subtilis]
PGLVQTQHNINSPELEPLSAQVREALSELEDEEAKSDIEQALEDFDAAVAEGDSAKIRKRGGVLKRLTLGAGSLVLTTATP